MMISYRTDPLHEIDVDFNFIVNSYLFISVDFKKYLETSSTFQKNAGPLFTKT